MKQRSLFVFCLIVGLAGFAASQTKSVTNADLEKYRQERLRAEREYSENYAKWGFPSPQELKRRQEQSRIETDKLWEKLRAESLERERLEAEREASRRVSPAYYMAAPSPVDSRYYPSSYLWSYGRGYRYQGQRPVYQSGYFAGGQFWPIPGTVRKVQGPRPAWIRPR